MRRSDSSFSQPLNSCSGDKPTSDESFPIYYPRSRSSTPNRSRSFSSLRFPASLEEISRPDTKTNSKTDKRGANYSRG
ncbi:hypothetical protein LINPERPRIM_LOCUS11880 [Linum perenne]